MDALALLLYVVFFGAAFGWRTWLQWRRTGDTGLRIHAEPGTLQWWAKLGFVAALVAGVVAPVAGLAGLSPVPLLDVAWVRIVGAIVAAVGIVATVGAQWQMGESWRIGVDPAECTGLVTAGVFARIRNPIFTAMVIAAAGITLLVANWVAVVGLVALVVAARGAGASGRGAPSRPDPRSGVRQLRRERWPVRARYRARPRTMTSETSPGIRTRIGCGDKGEHTMIDTATPVAPVGASTDEYEVARFGTGRLHVPGVASLGAGAVHAVAVGVHGDTTQAAVAFTAAAAFQLGWGAWAIVRPSKLVAALGALGNGALLAAWLVSTRSGISFVDGLETAKPVELGDGIAAGLAALAVALSVATLFKPERPIRLEQRVLASVASVAVAFVVLAGMVAAAQPSHHAAGAETGVASARPAAAVAPVPYDPARPIDLGGVEGVSAEQQARAENLIANTLSHLPTYDDPTAAEADGYRSINDGGTGYEHYINGEYRTDGRVLDPDRPESLVYQVRNGEKQLVAAMYMAEPGTTLETTPDVGGPLTQWHIHDNLCFAESGQVAGLTDASGGCAPPLVKPEPVPMIHVWIVPHPCGPFAALEGIAGGSIKPGEQRLCDAAHGGH